MNIFFTCKNTLLILIQMYRFLVLCLERRPRYRRQSRIMSLIPPNAFSDFNEDDLENPPVDPDEQVEEPKTTELKPETELEKPKRKVSIEDPPKRRQRKTGSHKLSSRNRYLSLILQVTNFLEPTSLHITLI